MRSRCIIASLQHHRQMSFLIHGAYLCLKQAWNVTARKDATEMKFSLKAPAAVSPLPPLAPAPPPRSVLSELTLEGLGAGFILSALNVRIDLHLSTLAIQPVRGSPKADPAVDHATIGADGVVTVLAGVAGMSTQSTLVDICTGKKHASEASGGKHSRATRWEPGEQNAGWHLRWVVPGGLCG